MQYIIPYPHALALLKNFRTGNYVPHSDGLVTRARDNPISARTKRNGPDITPMPLVELHEMMQPTEPSHHCALAMLEDSEPQHPTLHPKPQTLLSSEPEVLDQSGALGGRCKVDEGSFKVEEAI
jgi:hypothetical protein